MDEMPLVSVVIPSYNRANFLAQTIESVLQQDYPHIECIVVDGGSSDGTLEILHSYDGRIEWVSEPDNGQGDAINKGWKRSNGEILSWLNADDLWAVPGAVSHAVEYLQAHPEVEGVYGDCGFIDADGNVVGMSIACEWDLENLAVHSIHRIPQPASFIRREAVERVNWLDDNLFHIDYDLWLRIGLFGELRRIPVILAHARNHPCNQTRNAAQNARSCVQVIEKFFELPDVPENIIKKKRRAMSNAYVRGMRLAFYGQHWLLTFEYALRALLSDPSNAGTVFRRLKWRYIVLFFKSNGLLRFFRRTLKELLRNRSNANSI